MTDDADAIICLARLIAAMHPDNHPTGGKGTVSWGEPGHAPLCGCRFDGTVMIRDGRCNVPLTRGA